MGLIMLMLAAVAMLGTPGPGVWLALLCCGMALYDELRGVDTWAQEAR